MAYPAEYRYTKDHEWLRIEGNRARIGITHHAQEELGDIVFVELPTVGTSFAVGENLATVESVKAVGEVHAPFAGTVIEVNGELESAPEAVNQAAHEAGWLAVIESADPIDESAFFDAAGYEAFLAEG